MDCAPNIPTPSSFLFLCDSCVAILRDTGCSDTLFLTWKNVHDQYQWREADLEGRGET